MPRRSGSPNLTLGLDLPSVTQNRWLAPKSTHESLMTSNRYRDAARSHGFALAGAQHLSHFSMVADGSGATITGQVTPLRANACSVVSPSRTLTTMHRERLPRRSTNFSTRVVRLPLLIRPTL